MPELATDILIGFIIYALLLVLAGFHLLYTTYPEEDFTDEDRSQYSLVEVEQYRNRRLMLRFIVYIGVGALLMLYWII